MNASKKPLAAFTNTPKDLLTVLKVAIAGRMDKPTTPAEEFATSLAVHLFRMGILEDSDFRTLIGDLEIRHRNAETPEDTERLDGALSLARLAHIEVMLEPEGPTDWKTNEARSKLRVVES
jgi:hypothetical protein